MSRPASFGSFRTVLFFALAGLLPVPQPAFAAQDPALYFVCEVPTRGVSPGTTYLSDVVGPVGLTINNKSVFIVLNEAFQQFVADKYGHNSAAACSRFTDEANAKTALAQRVAKPPMATKIVETHWKYAATGTAAPAPPAAAQASRSEKPPAAAMNGFCSANIPGMTGYNKAKPTYFTPIFGFPKDGDYGAWFGEYVGKKYTFLPWPAYSCARGNGPISGLEAEMQRQMANAKAQGAGAVLTEWTSDKHQALMADLAKNAPPKPAPSPAPAARKADPDDDTPPAAKPAPAAAAKPAPQSPALYSFCYAYGKPVAPPAGPVKQHFYITQLFPLALNDRPNQAFQSFLRDAHPRENITASCSGPVALDAAQRNRQSGLDLRKKQSSLYDVVDVDWKFAR